MNRLRKSLKHARLALKQVKKLFSSQSAQATVEYLIVGLAVFAIIAGLALFGGRVREGLFSEHAADSASHAMTVNTAGSAGDVLLF